MRFLSLYGPYGTGKTSIAAAVSKFALASDMTVLFVTAADLVRRYIKEDQFAHKSRTYDLLVIDNLNTELVGSQWTQTTLEDILRDRYGKAREDNHNHQPTPLRIQECCERSSVIPTTTVWGSIHSDRKRLAKITLSNNWIQVKGKLTMPLTVVPDGDWKTIAIPQNVFEKKVKADYCSWTSAIAREFIQNGVDAGSKTIKFTLLPVTSDDPKVGLTGLAVQNDGQIMELDTCLNHLLCLGGTDKKDKSIGGYGIAKELLYFAWSDWSIRSANYLITGKGPRYKVTEDQPFVNGVTSECLIRGSVWVPSDIVFGIQSVAAKSDIQTKILLNGEECPKRKRGKVIYKDDYCSVEWIKSDIKANSMQVSVGGVWMFQTYLHNPLNGVLYLNLKGDTRSILTSNRDSVTSSYRRKIDDLKQKLAVEFSTLCSGAERNKLFKRPGFVFRPVDNTIKVDHLRLVESEKEPGVDYTRPCVMVSSGTRVPKKYQPDHWSKKTRKLMVLWSRVLQQVCKDANIDMGGFGIGITHKQHCHAMFSRTEGIAYFQLDLCVLQDKRKPLTRDQLITRMKISAVHEVTHACGKLNHSEDFVSRYETILETVMQNPAPYVGHYYSDKWSID